MGQPNSDKLNIRFVLKPDRRVPARLLPIVAGLVLSPTTENEESSDDPDETEDSDAPDD